MVCRRINIKPRIIKPDFTKDRLASRSVNILEVDNEDYSLDALRGDPR